MNYQLKEKLIELECYLHTSEARSSVLELDRLLSDEFREIGASGKYFGKAEVLSRLPEETAIKIDACDFEVRELSATVTHVFYKSMLYKNGELTRTSYRTSIWCEEDGEWKMRFHQGTVAE